MEHEIYDKNFPVKPGRYIRRIGSEESLMTVFRKGPLDLVYVIHGLEEVNEDYLRSRDATYCKLIPSKLAEECYAEGWHAAQYASQKPLGSYFPSYWNDDTFSKSMAEGK
jgi:hypothetical protein